MEPLHLKIGHVSGRWQQYNCAARNKQEQYSLDSKMGNEASLIKS